MKTVTAGIICNSGRILLTRRGPEEKLAGLWEFPGGKVEPDETLQQCLARELKEELGLEVSVGDVIAESVYTYEHGSIRLVAIEAVILSGRLTLTVHDQAEWVLPTALADFELAPADVPIANAVLNVFTAALKQNATPRPKA